MERIIITVPPTVGVTMRRKIKSHFEIINWQMPETTTSIARVAGPPSTTAVIQKGIEKAAVNMGSTACPPTGPMRRTCKRRGYAHDDQGGKYHPEEVGVVAARCLCHDNGRYQEGGGSKQTKLEPIP